MNIPFVNRVAWFLVVALLAFSQAASAQQKKKADAPGQGQKAPDADKKVPKQTAGAKASKPDASAGKLYYFKGEKKGNAGGAKMMVLTLQDVFTGKMDTLYVPNNDPNSKEYDPLSSVADALKDVEPGAVLQVETEKVKGRTMVKSISKPELKPGEELPDGYVYVESKEDNVRGMPSITVTLSKFGREFQVGVPFKKDDEYRDAEWEPDPKVDYVVRRLQAGTVVEALFTRKGGKLPMIAEIYEYRPPERGKFVGLKKVEFNGWPAAGFEITAADGTPVTFTLEGTEQTKNGETFYAPNPQHLRAVTKLKPDTEIEVRYRVDGRTWFLRDLKLIGDGSDKNKKSAKSSAKSEDAGEMKQEKKDPKKPAKADEKADKPAKE